MLMENTENNKKDPPPSPPNKKTHTQQQLVNEFHILHLPFTSLSFLNDGAAGAAVKGLICVSNGVARACVACVTNWQGGLIMGCACLNNNIQTRLKPLKENSSSSSFLLIVC